MPAHVCYVTVSDLALCQRCPLLLAYKIHNGYKLAWRVGIHGSGDYYGSIFHKYIAQVFFEAASNSRNKLHAKILASITDGAEALEEMIREDIFMPFIDEQAGKLTTGQITSMAKGVTTWVKAMYEFFREIPSLASDAETIFIKPEGFLQSNFDFHDGNFQGRLAVKGRYDALLFNVDKREARLFEFKGFKKSDVTVPLSQSLIYAWLLYKATGIIPSIEIIYLDEYEKPPVIFSKRTVREMIIAGLPGLFISAFNVISLRKKPEILQDKNLCSDCKYNNTCKKEADEMFRNKRRGASLLSVLIFFMAATLIMTQAFFFSMNSNESLTEERQLSGIKMRLINKIELGKDYLKTHRPHAIKSSDVSNKYFYKNTMVSPDNDNSYDSNIGNDIKSWDDVKSGNYFLTINDLDYTLKTDYTHTTPEMHEKMFAAMGTGYYLIRAYTRLPVDKSLMYQVLVKKDGENVITESFEEVWY